MSILKEFAEFGSEFSVLKRRLRDVGARLYETFPEYGRDFRRHLGIESEQAMELFHQTVSMKAVDNLNDFVRSHMLEPFDTSDQISDLIDHFDNLTRAHDAVQRARASSSSSNLWLPTSRNMISCWSSVPLSNSCSRHCRSTLPTGCVRSSTRSSPPWRIGLVSSAGRSSRSSRE